MSPLQIVLCLAALLVLYGLAGHADDQIPPDRSAAVQLAVDTQTVCAPAPQEASP